VQPEEYHREQGDLGLEHMRQGLEVTGPVPALAPQEGGNGQGVVVMDHTQAGIDVQGVSLGAGTHAELIVFTSAQ
jgi:hypothetical protein